MDTGRRVSVRALRILTYTILVKALVSAGMLFCTAAAHFAVRSSSGDISGYADAQIICQAVYFIDIVVCVMCLIGVISLSKRFVYTHRVMVAVLITYCAVILLFSAELRLALGSYEKAANAVGIITLVMSAAVRLLVGAAFLLLMKGFGEVLLQAVGDEAMASKTERLGLIYFGCNTVAALSGSLAGSALGSSSMAAIVLDFAVVILEFLMYRRASAAAFRIWRRRAFGSDDDGGQVS